MHARRYGLLALSALTLAAGSLVGAMPAAAQPDRIIDVVRPTTPPWSGPTPIVPQVHWRHRFEVALSAVAADITIHDQVASTTLELTLHNPSASAQEAEVMIPVPDGVTVRSFQYDGTGAEPTATLLPKAEARRIYDSIVSRQKDPGLLEFAGLNVIRSSAFPVPAGATQKVRITYEQVLNAENGRVDYALPRSESLATGTAVPWTIKATLKSAKPITTAYSPSHDLATDRRSPGELVVTVPERSASGPGAFRLSYLLQTDPNAPSATLIAYPDPTIPGGQGGYFMLVAAPPALRTDAAPQPREITLVIDRSGSMRGEKIEQAKKAAQNILDGLADGEMFNIIDYSDSIAGFAAQPVAKDAATLAQARQYVSRLEANGGTNIHDALVEALRPTPKAGSLPLVLFLTDGLPTVGERSEVKLRDAAKAANTHGRRIFTFGVGHDVNTPLLSNLARATRAAPTFVLPGEDVEVKVSQVYRRLRGPVLATPGLITLDGNGSIITTAVKKLQPSELADVFEGEQIIVLGQYTGGSPLRFRLHGDSAGAARQFDFTFNLADASARNGFVPRLWATRKVAALVDAIRQQVPDQPNYIAHPDDPRFKELVGTIVALSTRWGVMTEYTSFLALEPGTNVELFGAAGRDLRSGHAVAPAAAADAAGAALSTRNDARSGAISVAQEADVQAKVAALNVQSSNTWYAVGGRGDVARNQSAAVQNINAQTYYNRQNRWVDSRILDKAADAPEREVTLGTAEFDAVVTRLIAEGQAGVLALSGEIYILLDNQRVLIKQGT